MADPDRYNLAERDRHAYTASLSIRTCYEFEYQVSDNAGNTVTYGPGTRSPRSGWSGISYREC